MSRYGTFPGGWVESIIKLISAKAEAEAWLSLAKLYSFPLLLMTS